MPISDNTKNVAVGAAVVGGGGYVAYTQYQAYQTAAAQASEQASAAAYNAAIANGATAGEAAAKAQAAGAASGYQTYPQVLTTVVGAIGGLNLIANKSATVNGAKITTQVGFVAGITNLLKSAVTLVKTLLKPKEWEKALAAIGKAVRDVIHISRDSAPSAGSSPSATVGSAGVKYNPAGTTLYNNLVALSFYSTSTTTLFWSTCTATTTTGTAWWGIQTLFASTSTNSYFGIISETLSYTDQLSGVVASNGIMTIQQLVGLANQEGITVNTEIPVTVDGIVTPNIPNFAGTLYNPDYINSTTEILLDLLAAANTVTSTVSTFTSYKSKLDLYTSNLLWRVNTDLANQAAYLNQSKHLDNVFSAASLLSDVKLNQPDDIVQLYKSTIHPNIRDAVTNMSSVLDLQSVDKATTLKAIETYYIPNK
jgi:hypothetical protein